MLVKSMVVLGTLFSGIGRKPVQTPPPFVIGLMLVRMNSNVSREDSGITGSMRA